jgi:MSHA type pilus biogenesis protein MshL
MPKKIIIYMSAVLLFFIFCNPLLIAAQEDVDLISLDLKGMDIRDVLKILSQKSGLNIVADKDVKGTVSLYVKDIDVMGALDILVFTNDLAYEEEGTLIRIMTDRKYEKLHGQAFRDKTKTEIVRLNYANASNVAKVLLNMKTRVGKVIADDTSNTIVLIDNSENIERMKDAISEMDVLLVTEVFSLDYAKAELIKDKLEKALSENIGSLRFDERTNKIIVKDTPKKIEDIKKVIEAFDEKTKEVVIDANVIQVTLSDKYSYGIDWANITKVADVTLTGDTTLTTKLANTTANTLTIATSQNYTTVISLLKTFGETNVLSRPRITVADKEEAKILVGSKEVYVTSEVTTTEGGTYHTTDHVQFVDVGVTLKVTPEINREGYIRMKIKPEVSSTDATKTVTLTNPDGSTRTVVPYVTTSEAETTVLVKDNTTLIIGGLMKDTVTEYNDKVPFLGDIPILGRLFSTKGKGKEKTELVIFLTPHIIEGDRTTKEAEFYVEEWKKKQEEGRMEEPEEPKLQLTAGEKEPSKPLAKSVKKPKAQKEKWTPLSLRRAKGKGVDTPKAEPIEKVSPRERRDVTSIPITKKTPYEEYFLTVRGDINNLAVRQDVSGLKGEVELQFTLDREGYLIRGPVVLNKPDLTLVRAAVNCVKEASPFPPFPKTLKEKEAEFYITVRYE